MIDNKAIDRIDKEACGAYVESMCLIALEVFNPGKSDFIDKLSNEDPKIICDLLGWKVDQSNLDVLDSYIQLDENLSNLFFDLGKRGFVGRIYTPESGQFQTKDDKIRSCRIFNSISHIDYVYADNLEDFTEKIIETGKKNRLKDFNEEKAAGKVIEINN